MRTIGLLLVAPLFVGACSGGEVGGTARERTTTITQAPAHDGPVSRWLVYASRRGEEVVVFRRPAGPGEPEELFRYVDPGFDDAPDVATSPDGRLVGYIVGEVELHVRDVGTGRDAVLVTGEGIWVAFGQHYYEGGTGGSSNGQQVATSRAATPGVRTIALPQFIVDVVVDNLDRWSAIGPDGLVLVMPEGTPLRRENFRKRVWLPEVAPIRRTCWLCGSRLLAPVGRGHRPG